MTDQISDDPRDLAAGYALGILTPEELARYEAFLAEHPRARHQADDYAETVDALALEAPQIAPPPSMRADLLALIAQTPQLPADTTHDLPNELIAEPVLTPHAPAAPEVPNAVVETDEAPASVAPAPGPIEAAAHRRWFARPAVYLSAAAAAVVIVIGGVTLPPIIGQQQYQNQQQTALEQIRQAPDVQQASDTLAGGGEATVIWSASLAKSVLLVDGLAALPSDKTYELWYIDGSEPVPAGTFDAAASGTTVRALDGTLNAGAIVAITVEDEGGSDAPTTDPILAITTA
ncbi:anti-sigma factor [Microbacteriaceae bacterium VKM Ac-2855]|nr:anti-sigma factor [Microbacteriaceae bacterium VKM Ac-2855]